MGFLLLFSLSACDEFDYLGWLDQPIRVELHGEMPIIPVSIDEGPTRRALIDISTPVTVLTQQARSQQLPSGGPFSDYQLLVSLGERRGDLRLRDGLDETISRFIFRDVRVFDLPSRSVGLDQPQPIDGIIGGDLLTHFVVRFAYGAEPSISLGATLADTDEELSGDCDERLLLEEAAGPLHCSAVMGATRYGGGTILVGEQELDISATRLVLGACMAAEPFDPINTSSRLLSESSGVPVSALIATGFGVSVIARSAFERLKARRPELTEGAPGVLHLPNGAYAVSLTEIPQLALVDDLTVDYGPCQELSRRRRLLLAHRDGLDARDRERMGAAVAEVLTPVTFAILADEAPLLQGLRNELRPLVADVDVVLGGNFLGHFDPTFDFPGGRVVLRCADDDLSCRVIPRCYADDREPRCAREEE